MKVVEIKYWLKHYKELKFAVQNNRTEIYVKGYRKLLKFELTSDLLKLNKLIELIKSQIEDKELLKLFVYKFEKRYCDKTIISELYMSESSYQREKGKYYIKLITLCGIKGLLTDENEVKNIFK